MGWWWSLTPTLFPIARSECDRFYRTRNACARNGIRFSFYRREYISLNKRNVMQLQATMVLFLSLSPLATATTRNRSVIVRSNDLSRALFDFLPTSLTPSPFFSSHLALPRLLSGHRPGHSTSYPVSLPRPPWHPTESSLRQPVFQYHLNQITPKKDEKKRRSVATVMKSFLSRGQVVFFSYLFFELLLSFSFQ